MRRMWRTRGLGIAAVTLAMVVPALPVAVPVAVTHAQPSSFHDLTQWASSTDSFVSVWFNGTINNFVYVTRIDWQGNSATPLIVPTVGQTFYIHVETSDIFWNASYRMRILMPNGLVLVAPTLADDVYCEISNFSDQETRSMQPGECAAPFMNGFEATFPFVALSPGEKAHFWFPVKATTPLNGAQTQLISDQALAPAVSLPNPLLSSVFISAVASPTTPSAPTGLTATAGNGSASIAFSPASNGGSLISNYQYTLNNGVSWTSLSPADSTSPVTVPGLTGGTAYSIRLRAVNGIGAGAASAAVAVTPFAPPGAPTSPVATAGNGTVSVAFTAGPTNGSAISNYQYSLNSGAWIPLSPADVSSPVTIPGLVNGTTYGIRLRAVNAAGAGGPSVSVSSKPVGPPAAPTSLVAAGANGAVSVSFTAGSNGGAAITNYQYSLGGGAFTAFSPADVASPVRIAGLVNGTSYSIRLRAVNALGVSTPSAAVLGVPSPTPPAAPTALVATPTNGAATIAFTPGANNGAAITNYQYSVNAGAWIPLVPIDAVTPVRIPALVNGLTYGIRLRAVNVAGVGAASASVSVKPGPIAPAAPTRLVASPRSAAASIAFTPGSNGGASITNYQYSVNLGAWKPLSPADGVSPIRIPGLVNGVTYSIRLRAVNVKGAGAISAAVAVKPAAAAVVPAAPTAVTAAPLVGAASVGFLAGSDGGAGITNYQYSLNNGVWKSLAPADAVTPIRIPGLAAGATYAVRIRAVNVKGAGLPSPAVSVKVPTVPGVPSGVTAIGVQVFDPISGFFTFHWQASWAAPINGGSPITSYTARWWSAQSGGSVLLTCTTSTTTCVSNLQTSLFTHYWLEVTATNAVGSGAPSTRIEFVG